MPLGVRDNRLPRNSQSYSRNSSKGRKVRTGLVLGDPFVIGGADVSLFQPCANRERLIAFLDTARLRGNFANRLGSWEDLRPRHVVSGEIAFQVTGDDDRFSYVVLN